MVPEPRVEGNARDVQDPHTPTEILGRGEGQRKTKTFLRDTEVANVLGRIGGHAELLARHLRELHAHHYERIVEVETEDGETRMERRPEWLTYEELREEYEVIRMWERMHQEQVAHNASVDGFSVEQAIQSRDEQASEGGGESSAGSERVNGQGGSRWR